MSTTELNVDLNNIFERFVDNIKIKSHFKTMKSETFFSDLIFEICKMTSNNRSILFAESGGCVSPEIVDSLEKEGLIQKIPSGEQGNYSLTCKGLAVCIQAKFGIRLEDQFKRFLQLTDEKSIDIKNTRLSCTEKLVTVAFILLASTSIKSEIRLDDQSNQTVLGEVLEKTLIRLKQFNIVGKNEELKRLKTGESFVTKIMSDNLTDLARKTNLYYINDKTFRAYYFDLEKDNSLDNEKFRFLMQKIFDTSTPNLDYKQLYADLVCISQLYSPRLRLRKVNSDVSFEILRKMKDFFENGL